MKNNKVIKTSKVFLIPFILTFVIALLFSLAIFLISTNNYYRLYIKTTKEYASAHVAHIEANKSFEQLYFNNIKDNLKSAAETILLMRDNLDNESLNRYVDFFNINHAWVYNSAGEMILDSSNSLYLTFDINNYPHVRDFMISDEIYRGDDVLRKSDNRDDFHLYAYLRDEAGYFVQVALDDNVFITLIDDFSYDSSLKNIKSSNELVYGAFILNKNLEIEANITGRVPEIIKIDRDIYTRVLNNQQVETRTRFSKTMKAIILEIINPIVVEGEVVGVISIFYSLKPYLKTQNQLILVLAITLLFVMFLFSIFVLKYIINPLVKLEQTLISFNPITGEYIDLTSNISFFKGSNDAISLLSEHIIDKNIENKKLFDENYKMDITDYLTTLPNRFYLTEKMNEYIKANKLFAVIFIDINNFKTFNDTKGHLYGDKILINVVQTLKSFERKNLFMSRYGGDEFVLLFCYKSRQEIDALVKAIVKKFNDPVVINDEQNFIDFSLGISLFPEDDSQPDELIRKADLAMYESKKNTKERSIYYNESMKDKIDQELDIEDKIVKALGNDGFKIVLQPQVELNNNSIVSYEVLARFKEHNIGPGQFIEVAKKYNLIRSIGQIIIDKTIEVLCEIRNIGLELKTLYVNFTINELSDPRLIRNILKKLQENNLEPKYFGIEITEDVLISNEYQARILFAELKEHGFKIAIDDFGSGNTSLKYLINYPLGIVKLDRSFINQYLNKDNIAIFKHVTNLANELNYQVVAEGVETLEQASLLKDTKCLMAQGYYYYYPLEVTEVIELEKNKVNEN